MRYDPPRFAAVPWLDTLADLRAYGPPEGSVEHGAAVTLRLFIPEPWGRETSAVLNITTEDWRNGDVRLAIGRRMAFRVGDPPPTTALDQLLSNPRRDDYPDDNGASDVDE